MSADPVEIAQNLIRCPSVTPEDGGALDYVQTILTQAGFACVRLPFSDEATPDIDNLYARIGTASPHLCFAGHTDVVPTGDEATWVYPPFSGEIADGILYGRGAADMKGGIACFVAAVMRYLAENKAAQMGSISFLITGDEEGPAINGTAKMLEWLKSNGETLDHCLVGEPSNPEAIGEEIKIGRRGSLNGVLTVGGKQGHVAYPDLAQNPVPGLVDILDCFLDEPFDNGTEHFAPSNLEVTSIDVGNPAENVIPAQAKAMFNIRFNDLYTAESLKDKLRAKAGEVMKDRDLRHEFRFRSTGDCFLTEPGPLIDVLSKSIQEVTGRKPGLSTGGGTSDARFIKDFCPVIEFGLVNKTIHQINEHVPIEDLRILTDIYQEFIARYFGEFNHS